MERIRGIGGGRGICKTPLMVYIYMCICIYKYDIIHEYPNKVINYLIIRAYYNVSSILGDLLTLTRGFMDASTLYCPSLVASKGIITDIECTYATVLFESNIFLYLCLYGWCVGKCTECTFCDTPSLSF